ncbi:MAG TPA: transglycosylase domain-containing protein [Chloroflexota bacterium]|nr:transglycosylase domain-containing protein [Chloroflexota bacterium]
MSRALVRRRIHRTPPPSYRILWVLAALALFSAVGCGGLTVGGAGTAYAFVTKDLPNPADLSSRPLAQVTQLYDRTGEHLLYEFYEERRIAIPLSQVAPVMLQATLAIEDAGFYQHRGFDIRGIARAFLNNIRAGGEIVGGGSTITQQLVKRSFLSDESSYLRKMKELVLAVQVETVYSKDQVFEMYLNQVYYGNQAYGIEAAALSYFGKHAKDLALSEASILAGLVQLPSRYDPVTNPKAAHGRQEQVLEAMVRNNMVTQEEADAAIEQSKGFTYRLQETRIVHPHFAFFVKEQLQQRINPDILRGGLKVITTLDVPTQDMAQQIVQRRVRELRFQSVNNGSMVAIDPRTGEIMAMVGSVDYYNKAIDGQVNVATAQRQPGSSFKPFTYAAALATKKWTAASGIPDQPISWPDIGSKTGVYRPQNYDEKFHGTPTLRSALANSYNIPALLVQDAVGAQELIKFARNMGVTTELPAVRSLTLGAGVVRLLDMTSAYGVFGNGGVRVEPNPFLKITDSQGRVVYELTQPKGEQVLSAEVAYIVSDILSDNRARSPMFGNVLDLTGGRLGAVKTGTTNDYKDSLTIGFTPSLAVGAWVGNTDNSPMAKVAGSLGAGYIWKEFMDTYHRGKPLERFQMPPGIVRTSVCGYQEVTLQGVSSCASIPWPNSAARLTLPSVPGVQGRPAAAPTRVPPRPTAVLPPS